MRTKLYSNENEVGAIVRLSKKERLHVDQFTGAALPFFSMQEWENDFSVILLNTKREESVTTNDLQSMIADDLNALKALVA